MSVIDYGRQAVSWVRDRLPRHYRTPSAHESLTEWLEGAGYRRLAADVREHGERLQAEGVRLEPCTGRRYDRELYLALLPVLAYAELLVREQQARHDAERLPQLLSTWQDRSGLVAFAEKCRKVAMRP